MDSPRPRLADLSLLAITALWGVTFVTVKDALDDASPMAFLTARFTVGTLAAAALARRALLDAGLWRRGILLGALLFLGYLLQTLGLTETSPARSAFITGLTVVFVPFAAAAVARLARTAPPPRSFATLPAIALAILGLGLLTGVELGQLPTTGDLLTLGCAVAYAFHIAALSHLARGSPPVALVTVQLATVASLSAVSLPFTDRTLTWTPGLISAVLITGVLASALAISVQAWAQSHTPAVRAAIIYALEPVFAVLWGALLGHGLPTAAELAGGACLIGAVLVAELGPLVGSRSSPRDTAS